MHDTHTHPETDAAHSGPQVVLVSANLNDRGMHRKGFPPQREVGKIVHVRMGVCQGFSLHRSSTTKPLFSCGRMGKGKGGGASALRVPLWPIRG